MRKTSYMLNMLTILLMFVMMASVVHAETTEPKDGEVARKAWMAKLRILFDQGKYAELEKIAQKIRQNKEHFPDGAHKIRSFYRAFDKPTTKNDESWLNILARIEAWQKAFPESITPRIAKAIVWDEYAWDARGSGFANKVTEQGWELFNERLNKAHELVEKAPLRSSDDCPMRHEILLSPSYSSDLGTFEKKFRDAIAFDPSYLAFYDKKAENLLPRWHGTSGDSIRFADEAVSLAPKNLGMIVYARIMWFLWVRNEINTFKEPGVSWEKVKQGYRDLEKKYPNSPWNLNWFCRLACNAGDKETAQVLFKRIGSSPYIEAWGNRAKFEEWRQWALSGS